MLPFVTKNTGSWDDALQITESSIWKDKNFLYKVEEYGFRNIDWDQAPDTLLIYLFLHDEPTIGDSRSESTKKEYFRDIRQFYNFVQSEFMLPLRLLKSEHLLKYQRFLEAKYKPTTATRKSSVVKSFFKYLLSKNILQQDITSEMKKFKIKKDELVNRDLYDYEVKQLIKHFKEEDWFAYTLFYLLVSTGMRINELATAKWDDLRFEPAVNHYFLTVLGKGEKRRDVIIFADVLEVVKENRKRKGLNTIVGHYDGTAFFPKYNGSHYNKTYLSNEFTRIVNSAPFDFIQARLKKEEHGDIRYRITPHTCRHYTAAYYMDQGIDPKAIQDMLGHSSLMTTERYLRRKRDIKNHAGVQLGELFLS